MIIQQIAFITIIIIIVDKDLKDEVNSLDQYSINPTCKARSRFHNLLRFKVQINDQQNV